MLKTALLASLTASSGLLTRIRQSADGGPVTVQAWVPSLGVLATTDSQAPPLLRLRSIFTSVRVPELLQVRVGLSPIARASPPFG